MLFAKQKALIGLLFFLLPVMATLAFIETPVVSGIVLQFALKLVRFRTGLRVDARAWNVDPLSFSASLDDLVVGLEDLNLRAPRVSVQLSPPSLILGNLHLTEVRVDSPFLYGRAPESWFRKSKNTAPVTKREEADLPTWIGEKITGVMAGVEKHNISFDRLRLKKARVQTREAQLFAGDLEVMNLDGGQARVEWNLDEVQVPGQFELIDKCEGSISLLRERRNQYFLFVQSAHIKISAGTAADAAPALEASVNGRWPGEFDGKAQITAEKLKAWMGRSPVVAEQAPKMKSSGGIELQFHGTTKKSKLETMSGKISTRKLIVDDFFPNDVEAEFKYNGAATDVTNFKLTLPTWADDAGLPKGTLTSPLIHVEQNAIKGTLTLTKAGLCGILTAASVEECFVNVHFDGTLPFEGTLSPLLIKASPDFKTPSVMVITDTITAKNYKDELLTVKAARLTGTAVVGPKDVRLNGFQMSFDDGSHAQADGRIVYLPTSVDLTVSTESAKLQNMLKEFLNLEVQGQARIDAKIDYRGPDAGEKHGHTHVLGGVAIDGFGLETQTLGTLTGPVEYNEDELRIGPLKLANGGGRAIVSGLLKKSPAGTTLHLDGNFARIEMDAHAPASGSPLFHGFVSGTASLDGFTDIEKHPDGFLKGPIHLDIDTLTAFGIPYQSAVANAYYKNRILEIHDFKARKNSGYVYAAGDLHPDSGTELKFSSDEISLKNLGWNPSVDLLQDGTLRVDEGHWSPTKGWRVHSQLNHLKIAGRGLPNGSFELSGDDNHFRSEVALGSAAKFAMESDVSKKESRLVRMSGSIKDEGLYGVFAWLKKWPSEHPIGVGGDLDFAWTPEGGTVSTHGLKISGPQGSDAKQTLFFSAEGPREFAWQGSRITKNNFEVTGPTALALKGAPGASAVDVSLSVPAALLDLFVPTFRFREGRVSMKGRLPMPPDFQKFQATAEAEDTAVFIPGISQPITQVKADMELSNGRLNFKSLQGQVGTGDISASGIYRVDMDQPGLFVDVSLNRAQVDILDDILFDATGDISLKGEQPPYLMTGKILATNSLYTKEFKANDLGAAPLATEPSLRFGMDVEIGSNSRIRNSSIAAAVSGKLALSGTDLKPEMQGNIDFLSGSIYAKDSQFRISQGRVTFVGGSEKIPNVNVLATTTVKQTSQDYRIQLQARGPADQMSLDLSSDPPLQQSEIVNLLAYGVLRPAAGTSLDAARFEVARSAAFQAVFGQFIGSNLNKSTGINLRVGATTSDISQTTPVTKVMAEKKISDNMTASFGRSLDLAKPETDVQVDYKLLRNLNLTGVYQSGNSQDILTNETEQTTSAGVDLRFKFDLK